MKLTKLFGLHSVQAALDYSPKNIQQAWVDTARQDKRLTKAIEDLLDLGIQPEKVDRKDLIVCRIVIIIKALSLKLICQVSYQKVI